MNFFTKNIGALLVITTISCIMINDAKAGLEIYYIRHAEAGHNVKKGWQHIPKEHWLDYVGDSKKFTPKGKIELSLVSQRLQEYQFDFIAASPIWRARHTILPYLKDINAKAEIWPELYEIAITRRILETDLPQPKSEILAQGQEIEIPQEEAEYFSLRVDDQGKYKFKVPKLDPETDEHAANSREVIQAAVEQIKKRFAGTDKKILFSGHGSSGRGILMILTQGKEIGDGNIINTGLWMVKEQPNGEFKLKIYNNQPVD